MNIDFGPMSFERFAAMNATYPFFDTSVMLGNIEPIKYHENWVPKNYNEEYMFLFGLIFGAYGVEKNIHQAIDRCNYDLNNIVLPQVPKVKRADNLAYSDWLQIYGRMEIILGTAYAYNHDIIKASFHLIKGLKSESININLPYCDFIRFVFDQLGHEDVSEMDFKGWGFDADHPMGSVYGGVLMPSYAEKIIPDMEGVHGEQIIAKVGRGCEYGHFIRLGSICNIDDNIIDIYETFIIDTNYKLSKIKFYFYGYFKGYDDEIKLADGFRLIDSSFTKISTYIEN